jgi:hypothetical protein
MLKQTRPKSVRQVCHRQHADEIKMIRTLQRFLTPAPSQSLIYRTLLLQFGPVLVERQHGRPFDEVVKLKA